MINELKRRALLHEAAHFRQMLLHILKSNILERCPALGAREHVQLNAEILAVGAHPGKGAVLKGMFLDIIELKIMINADEMFAHSLGIIAQGPVGASKKTFS